MAVVVTERFASRPLTDEKAHERIYSIIGTSDESVAMQALKEGSPLTANNLTRGECQIEPEYIDTENEGDCIWLGRAPYAPPERPQVTPLGGVIIQGTTTGGTQTVKVGLVAPAAYTQSGGSTGAPNFGGGINVHKGGVDGVEIGVRQFEFTVTKAFAPGTFPLLKDLYELSWTTNAGQVTFTDTETGLSITLPAGEGLFKGCDFGRGRGDGGLEIVFHMAASPNKVNFAVGDIGVTEKKGWQYLWVYFEEAEDDTANVVVSKPLGVYVETLYDSADWTGLKVAT